jgi:F-type H+-transporting ATPase subunit a
MEVLALAQISPDEVVFWQRGFLVVNATLVYTWLVMALLISGAHLLTRHAAATLPIPRRQQFLEAVVTSTRETIRDLAGDQADHCLPFIGALFLFIATSNILAIVPGYVPPTASLSTTAALALCVFIAVPLYGVRAHGFVALLKEYFRPNIFFFPLHIVSQMARTIALTVRLFGNVMSHEKIVGLILAVAPLFVPVVMQIFGLIIGVIQAYIFAILAMVYIAAATSGPDEEEERSDARGPSDGVNS